MSGKYLPLKFAFVLLLIMLSLGSLFWGNGLKMGPDIAGGYSMIFEIYNEENRSDLVDRTIAVLKKRIDPTGLSSLEWRPLKNDRFEVRMPAASKKSQELRNEYLQARETLLEGNIERSEIRALRLLDKKQQQVRIKELTGKDTAQAERLSRLLGAMDTLDTAEERLKGIDQKIRDAKNPTQQQLVAMQKERSEARGARDAGATEYRSRFETMRKGNINPRELMGILKLFDEAKAKEGKDEKRNAIEMFESRLDRFRKKYSAQVPEIDRVVKLYRQWSDIRRPLEAPSDLIRMIRKAGVLEFRIAPHNPDFGDTTVTEAEISRYSKSLDNEGPDDLRDRGGEYAWYPIRGDTEGYNSLITYDYAGKTYLLLSNKPSQRLIRARDEDNQWSLASARVGSDTYGNPAVNFTFDETGAKLFSRLTSGNVKKVMAILLDDEVYSAPTITEKISGRVRITGRFTAEEVDDLVRILEAGSLPGKVNPDPVSQNSFGPAIGEANMEMAFRAAKYGLLAVAVFMVIYYLICGAIAVFALVLNMILVLGAMSMFDAVLTLPGIAGVILTIGMAVDANVLIFERLREEQAKGLAIRQALKNAYERAFTAIIDANITTLLICLFLFVVFDWVGMEEVRGFAITLGLGVGFSMFTALLVSRWVFQLLLDTRIVQKPLPMLRLIPKININWMQKRYFFWGLSIVLMTVGIASLVWQGQGILGIEFSSGTQATLKFRDDALIEDQLSNDGLVRERINSQATEAAAGATDEGKRKTLQKLIATARVETLINENRVQEFLSLYGNDKGQVTMTEWIEKKKKSPTAGRFFELIDTNRDGVLEKSELETNLPQTAYQISTTVTDAKLIRGVVNEAFGKALQRRLPCKFVLARDEDIPQMGVHLAPDGQTRITPDLLEGVTAAFRDELLDFEGGFMFVVEKVSPSITETDLQGRIRDIRMQPDFGPWAVNPYSIIGLTPAPEGEEGYSAFLVLVRPADPKALKTKSGLEKFLTGEQDVLTNALRREDPMVATNFDAAIAGETAQLAIVVVIMSWLAIVVYLWLRFGSIQWGLAAVVCLIHDVIIVVGLVAASGWINNTFLGELLGIASFKINLAMVAALLTVIGYSVNDTIVIFDRIRENRGKLRTVSGEVINASINQSLPRTVLTSLTTFLVVFIMYVWGGAGIKAFNYALLMGIIFGTYSSVAVASPLLLGFKQALVAKTVGVE